MVNNILKGISLGLVSLIFISCGAEYKGDTTPPTTPFSTISGVVSDGPIKNAKVCIVDVDSDTEYCPTFTDEKGKYSFDYILENGKEYLIISYGSNTTYGTEDLLDNAGSDMEFVMFQTVKTAGSI